MATAIIVVGLILEFVALLFFSKGMSHTEKALLVIGSILVALGVGGEFIFSGRSATAATELQRISDEKIATLGEQQSADHKIAAQAAAHAADLGVTVDNLRDFVSRKQGEASEAANSAKRTAAEVAVALSSERDVRQKFASMVEPRQISDESIARMANQLGKFKDQSWTTTTFWDLKEPLALADRIYAVLGAAGWKYNNSGSKGMLLGGVAGIQVYVHPKAKASSLAAATALVGALNQSGLDAVEKSINDPEHPDDEIRINVGTKN